MRDVASWQVHKYYKTLHAERVHLRILCEHGQHDREEVSRQCLGDWRDGVTTGEQVF